MRQLKMLLLMLFFVGGSTVLFSEDCTSDADCASNCFCEGEYINGNCKPTTGTGECCVCQQGGGGEQ